jgi:hypothetical protein
MVRQTDACISQGAQDAVEAVPEAEEAMSDQELRDWLAKLNEQRGNAVICDLAQLKALIVEMLEWRALSTGGLDAHRARTRNAALDEADSCIYKILDPYCNSSELAVRLSREIEAALAALKTPEREDGV